MGRWMLLGLVLAACGKSDAVSGFVTLTGVPPFAPETCVDGARVYGMRDGAIVFIGHETPGAARAPMLAVWDGPEAAIMYYTADTVGDSPEIVDAHSHCSDFAFGKQRVSFRCKLDDRVLAAELVHGGCP